MDLSVVFLISFVCFFVGYIWGNSKKGKLVGYTNELPNKLLTVISIDRVSAVLEEISIERKRFLVATEVFGGKPIRPKDVVRKVRSNKEQYEWGIPNLGYPPLVKDVL